MSIIYRPPWMGHPAVANSTVDADLSEGLLTKTCSDMFEPTLGDQIQDTLEDPKINDPNTSDPSINDPMAVVGPLVEIMIMHRRLTIMGSLADPPSPGMELEQFATYINPEEWRTKVRSLDILLSDTVLIVSMCRT
ncbi:hypothetical protein ACEPPN_014866 [Leptodophora sp. 'Broadleaf-Isolate-01']